MKFQFSLKSLLKASVILAFTIYSLFRLHDLGLVFSLVAIGVGFVAYALSLTPEFIDGILDRANKRK
jgi:hypothetical protein